MASLSLMSLLLKPFVKNIILITLAVLTLNSLVSINLICLSVELTPGRRWVNTNVVSSYQIWFLLTTAMIQLLRLLMLIRMGAILSLCIPNMG